MAKVEFKKVEGEDPKVCKDVYLDGKCTGYVRKSDPELPWRDDPKGEWTYYSYRFPTGGGVGVYKTLGADIRRTVEIVESV